MAASSGGPRGIADRRGVLRGALATALLPAQGQAQPRAAPPLATFGGSGCDAMPGLTRFERWLGRPVDLVLDFGEYRHDWDEMVRQAEWLARCWRPTGRRVVLGLPLVVASASGPSALRRGAEGAFDSHFAAVARILAAGGQRDAILRPGWEFNVATYAWSALREPRVFAAFWRRTALAMRAAAPGARFVFDWNPNLGDGPVAEAYPGDDVVDVIGLDTYNQSWPFHRDPERRWRHLLEHRNGLRWHRDFAAARGKPRSFPEWGTGTRADGHGGGDDPLFIRNMLAWMREGPPVAYHGYWDHPSPEYDAQVTDGRRPLAAAALRAGLWE
jgi:hypothetical protein